MINHNRIKRIHFIGIGGSGMSGIAEVLHNSGFLISGSDIVENENVRHLRLLKIPIAIGHDPQNLHQAEAVVFSSAISEDNPEIIAARKLKLPLISRAEMLAELMRLKTGVAIAGTHGKTTTTSMIAYILEQNGFDPTFVVGGIVKGSQSGARLGKSAILIAEADESDGSFLNLNPIINVITNIENDHLEFYKTMQKLRQAFLQFANHIPFYGATVVNKECPNIRRLLPLIRRRTITFGKKDADYSLLEKKVGFKETQFKIKSFQRDEYQVRLTVGGEHNIFNAMAAIAVTQELAVPIKDAIAALAEFKLPQRRLQILLENSDFTFIDDYAHHPTEIASVLQTVAKGDFKRIIVIFQPHRYTRLRILGREFARVLSKSQILIIAPIYSANQQPIPGVDSAYLAEMIRSKNERIKVFLPGTLEEIRPILRSYLQSGDAVVFLSAGNLSRWAHKFAEEVSNA